MYGKINWRVEKSSIYLKLSSSLNNYIKGDILGMFSTSRKTASFRSPSDSAVSEMARSEPGPVETFGSQTL